MRVPKLVGGVRRSGVFWVCGDRGVRRIRCGGGLGGRSFGDGGRVRVRLGGEIWRLEEFWICSGGAVREVGGGVKAR